MNQHNPPHPGALIKRTYIDPFEHVSSSTLNRLINEKSSLSPEMAIKLSIVQGRSAGSWLSLQDQYDLWRAAKKVKTKPLKPINFDVAV